MKSIYRQWLLEPGPYSSVMASTCKSVPVASAYMCCDWNYEVVNAYDRHVDCDRKAVDCGDLPVKLKYVMPLEPHRTRSRSQDLRTGWTVSPIGETVSLLALPTLPILYTNPDPTAGSCSRLCRLERQKLVSSPWAETAVLQNYPK